MFLFLLFYLALVIVRPHEYPAYADSGVPWLQVALAGALLFWVLAGRKSLPVPQLPLLFAFLLAGMLSVAATGWMGGALEFLERFGPSVAVFIVVTAAITERERVRKLMAALVLLALVPAVHGIDQKAQGIGWTGVPLIQDGRIQYLGIFNDPNDLGMLFVIVLPMAFFLAARGGLMGLRRLFWLSAAGVLIYAIYLTDSRGTLLATAALAGMFAWRRFGIVVAGMFGAAGLGAMMLLPSRLQELEVGEASAHGRVEAWYEGIQMFISSPLYGVGANQFSDLYRLTAHNSFVLVMAEIGIIGITLWLAFLAYGFRMMLAMLRQPLGTADAPGLVAEDHRVALTLLLSLAGAMVCAFFLSRSYVVVIYLLSGLVAGAYLEARRRAPALPAFPLSRDLVLWPAVGCAFVVLMYLVVKVLLAMV
jgi:putative inorganic carbon (hco3(-)) transporter